MTTPGDQSPTLAERLKRAADILALEGEEALVSETNTYPNEYIREALAEIERLTLALAASEAALSGARTDIERCQEVLATSAKELIDMRGERDEAYRQNPILREQVRELQERLAVLDEAYRAVTEQLSRSATLAATAEVERDSLREQLAQAQDALWEIANIGDGYGARHQMSGTNGEGHADCREIADEALGIEFSDLYHEAPRRPEEYVRARHAARKRSEEVTEES